MKVRSLILSTGLLSITLLTSSVALAVTPGWYVGAGGGWTSTNASASDMHPNLQSEHAPTSTNVDDSDAGWKIFAGYQFNTNFAVEGSYTDLGTFTLDGNITLPGVGTFSDKLKPTAWCLSGVGTLPVQGGFSLIGKVGVCRWDDNFSGFHIIPPVGMTPEMRFDEMNFSKGTDPLISIGAGYDVGKNVTLRGEWERYFNVIHDNKDVDMFSINAMYRF